MSKSNSRFVPPYSSRIHKFFEKMLREKCWNTATYETNLSFHSLSFPDGREGKVTTQIWETSKKEGTDVQSTGGLFH